MYKLILTYKEVYFIFLLKLFIQKFLNLLVQ